MVGFDNYDELNSTMPLELRRSVPRGVCLTSEGIWRALSSAVILLIGLGWALLIVLGSVHRKQHYAELQKMGRHAVATIDRIDGSGVYYSFTYNGVPFAGRSSIPSQKRTKLQVLGPLSILYLASNPNINRPEDWEETATEDLGILILPILVLALGSWMGLDLCFTRRIIRDGIVATGVVQRCDRYSRSGQITVIYEFSIANGAKKKGRGWSQELLAQGTRIWVLYVPARSNANTSYPLHHWRAAI